MPWLPDSLQSRLQQRPLPLSSTIRLVEQISAALTVAHQRDVIHRDVKPSNILLDEYDNAYLADFGIAKDLHDGGLTLTQSIVGSPAYLAPEQAQGRTLSPSTDLYSFGLVLYEIITGQHPFPDESPAALLQKQIYAVLPNLNEIRSDLLKALNVVVQRATAKAPDDRYLDALSWLLLFERC
jgi:serine/threonine protein kinase